MESPKNYVVERECEASKLLLDTAFALIQKFEKEELQERETGPSNGIVYDYDLKDQKPSGKFSIKVYHNKKSIVAVISKK